MKAKVNSAGRLFGLACVAVCLTAQAWPRHAYSTDEHQQPINDAMPAASSADATVASLAEARALKEKAAELYDNLPLRFEANHGQADSRVTFLTRARGFNLYLAAGEALIELVGPSQLSSRDAQREKAITGSQSSAVKMKLTGANPAARVVGLDVADGTSNYFTGNDPKKWRTNVPSYTRVEYQNVYPGVDLLYYGNQRQLEYDFTVAPGASLESIGLTFEGARRIRVDSSGDLLVETRVGEIRQRKPVIYQQTDGNKHLISGGYVIRGEREVGFEVGEYDSSHAIVIDPVLVYSTSIGGFSSDSANAVALDAMGNAYVTGVTTSVDFPAINAFQPSLKEGPTAFVPSDAFIAKFNPSGTALLYSTYLGGSAADIANGIAVDSSGNAYVTGFTGSEDFPTTAVAFQKKASRGGDAFITKLNAMGNALVYSTYLGGSTSTGFLPNTTLGRGIAVDQEGSAYVTGSTFSENFPLKKPAQRLFNKGNPFGVGCLGLSLAPTLEDGFVTKLDPSGGSLVYSTYLGGNNADEANGIALDSSGSAYVTGVTCSFDFADSVSVNDTASGAFVVKLSPSGKKFVYARRIGGRGQDAGNGIAVDSEGNAYVTGKTDSDDFPVTSSSLQPRLGGSVLYASSDGGSTWGSISGLSNSSVGALAIDPTNPLRIYAGVSGRFVGPGLLVSTDGGVTWGNAGSAPFPSNFATAIVVDPKNPSIVYTDHFKSTDGAMTWTLMRFSSGGAFGPARLLVDPVNSSTVYLASFGGVAGDVVFPPRFLKTTDGGSTWESIRKGADLFGPSSAVLDPKNPATLYAAKVDLYKSTDGGNTWNVPYNGFRSFYKLAIDPVQTSTLYLADASGGLHKTTDAGVTFTALVELGVPVNELQVDPLNPSTIYAAAGSDGLGGTVFKSTDGGHTWNGTGLIAGNVNTLAIDPVNPLRIFAAVEFDVDSFVIKSNPAGSALVYSTYFGSRSPDTAAGIGVDAVGNVYLTGRTASDRFPTKDALQTAKPSGLFSTAAFTTKLDAAGSAILFSTYLGGSEPSFGSGIAVDPSGKVCVVGTTGTANPTPAGASVGSVHGGLDALVVKIASPPRIGAASIQGKHLIVTGEGFDAGAVILINGAEQRTRNDESRTATMLIGKKAAKNIAPGQQVNIRVRNADGLQSESLSFTRLP